ncbi:MAG: glycosyltransferase [Flavobacteriaceae bacterium]|nr:glycosyltransferase [Flavobacteriaceae bacterium]
MKRIIISVTNDLATDQRVYKVSKTLQKLGYDILLIGRKLPNSLPLKRPYKTYRMKLLFNKGFLFYAEYNLRLFFKLLFTKKDILLANDLDTLLPNYLISQFLNKKLVYDSHELFTEVPELINRPRVQKIWLKIEKNILPKLKNCYTVCQSIADYYNDKYNTNFSVIRNLPEKLTKELKEPLFKLKNEKIIIYQGALNLGRGIELMIETMQYLNNIIFVIIGDGDISTQLKQQVINLKLDDTVRFSGKIIPKELRTITPTADLGISIEEDLGLNYRYALPNKIFDYIQVEIPILVSDLTEMKGIIDSYKVGEVIIDRNPKALASQIEKILKKDTKYWKENLKNASKELIWENEKEKLITFFL